MAINNLVQVTNPVNYYSTHTLFILSSLKDYFMTAKEKAKNLYDKFFNLAYVPWNGGENEMPQEEAAKECALICVEEVLITLSMLPQDDLKVKWDTMFWEEVKSEIEKLK